MIVNLSTLETTIILYNVVSAIQSSGNVISMFRCMTINRIWDWFELLKFSQITETTISDFVAVWTKKIFFFNIAFLTWAPISCLLFIAIKPSILLEGYLMLWRKQFPNSTCVLTIARIANAVHYRLLSCLGQQPEMFLLKQCPECPEMFLLKQSSFLLRGGVATFATISNFEQKGKMPISGL